MAAWNKPEPKERADCQRFQLNNLLQPAPDLVDMVGKPIQPECPKEWKQVGLCWLVGNLDYQKNAP